MQRVESMFSSSGNNQQQINNPIVQTAIEDSAQQTCVRDAHSQQTCEGLKQNNPVVQTAIGDSAQQTCVGDTHSQQTCGWLKQSEKENLEGQGQENISKTMSIKESNVATANDTLQISHVDYVDFLVSEMQPRIHFKNACFNVPSVYSCAVDCFLEISYRIFSNYVRIIPQDNRCNLFNIIMRTMPIYDVALSNSNTQLLSEVREPVWNYIISECSSFVPRNCDTEFSQIFTGSISIAYQPRKKNFFKQHTQ